MYFSLKKLAVVFALLFFSAYSLQAEEEKKKEEKVYSSSTSLSLLFTSGNTHDLTLGFDTEQNAHFKKNRFQFKANIIYSESDGSKESELYSGHIQYKRKLSSKAYLLGAIQAEKNVLAGYKYRFLFSFGAGYFWKNSEKLVLFSEGTLGWSAEKNIEKLTNLDIPLSFASLLLSNTFILNISSTAEFTEHILLFINLEDTKDYRISPQTSLSVSISRHLALKMSHQLKYNHAPVPGFKGTDHFFLSSLVLNL